MSKSQYFHLTLSCGAKLETEAKKKKKSPVYVDLSKYLPYFESSGKC